jgi:Fe-S cluster biogenesis protein NfuA
MVVVKGRAIPEDDPQLQMQQIEELISKIESFDDPLARETSLALVRSLMDFHSAALDRLMEIVAESKEAGVVFNDFATDELVSNLLLLYGLHPVSTETRVRKALEQVRPYIESHGGSVELLSIKDAVVHLRMDGSCKSCPSSELTLKLAIEDAVYAAAPDVVSIQAEGVTNAQPSVASNGLIQIGKGNGHSKSERMTVG